MLAFGFSISDFIHDSFATIFINMLDRVVYGILAVTYRIWVGITKLDIFGGSEAGEKIYDGFTERLYTILAIAMVFIFAYRLILYILDPDGKYQPKEKSGTLIKRIILSIILVIVAPVLFKYMAAFQYHVVSNNTIPNIILGTEGGNRYLDNGKQLAMITLMSFYHPNGTTYNTFVHNVEAGEEGNIVSVCDQIIVPTDQLGDGCKDGTANPNICASWRESMYEWCADEGAIAPTKIIANSEVRNVIDDTGGTEYMWIVCTAGACLVIYFLVAYCIAIGTRAVKLGFLEIIAPIPIMMRMFDPAKYFTPWMDQIKKTYLELFLRIAIISFVIYMCTLVPTFIELIANAF